MSKSAGNALISVYDKTGIVDFAKGLIDLGFTIYASSGSAKLMSQAGLKVSDVAELVGGKPILGHRVVTLSREIYAGVLADLTKPADMRELKKLKIPQIDVVCVDMYPLEAAITAPKSTLASVIEQTDIGGPTLLRAAAKGRRIVLSRPEQRSEVLHWLEAGQPQKDSFIAQLCARAEYEVARYVSTSAANLAKDSMAGSLAWVSQANKYGENPQQQNAALYADNRVKVDRLGLDQFTHVKGTELSYNNMIDIDRMLQTATHIAAGYERNFGQIPSIAIGVKHGNACGVGVASDLVAACQKMLVGDTRAIFGGLVLLNGALDARIAKMLMRHAVEGKGNRLLDGVVAASVTDEALAILTREKLRVVVNPALARLRKSSLDSKRRLRPIRGGLLAQPNYTFVIDFGADYIEKHGRLSSRQKQDLVLAWAIGSTSNSNTITLVKNGQLIGNGVGQQDRVGAGQLALSRTTVQNPKLKTNKDTIQLVISLDRHKLDGAVAYSDSFFPFPDGPNLLASAGIKAMLTSRGSIMDQTVFAGLKAKGVSVVTVPDASGRGFFGH